MANPPPISEFEQAMLLIAMTQTTLLAVIAATANPAETDRVTGRLNTDLSRHTPNIAKWLGKPR